MKKVLNIVLLFILGLGLISCDRMLKDPLVAGSGFGDVILNEANVTFADSISSSALNFTKAEVKIAGKTGTTGVAFKNIKSGNQTMTITVPSADGKKIYSGSGTIVVEANSLKTASVVIDSSKNASFVNGVIKLSVKAPTGKTAVNLHTWGTDATGAGWPGVAMKDEGNGWFTYTVKGTQLDGLIFNWDGGQTANLSVDGAGNYFYDANTSAWLDAIKVNVKAPTGKTAVNLHTWGTDATGAGWPGVAMKDEGNGWFSYIVEGPSLDGLIFNWDGGQTANLSVTGAGEFFYDANTSAWLDVIKLNVIAPTGKTAVNLHTWGTDATGAGWPGVAMKDEGNGWFSYIVEGPSLDGLIFNWDGGQTANLSVAGTGEYFYDANSSTWFE